LTYRKKGSKIKNVKINFIFKSHEGSQKEHILRRERIDIKQRIYFHKKSCFTGKSL